MEDHSQFRLLSERRFLPFFVTQFAGAFNDNLFKNALLLLVTYSAGGLFGLSSDVVVNLAAMLFILPFFLFSAIAGQVADRYEKSSQSGGRLVPGSLRRRVLRYRWPTSPFSGVCCRW